ncbi:MAG: lytic transglycosylase domain-containing protein [Rhodospirillaceae bacterium]|nr:MAG: lytic transglycosylase domain-containing protein [Rhodospirillaceae bacterium]
MRRVLALCLAALAGLPAGIVFTSIHPETAFAQSSAPVTSPQTTSAPTTLSTKDKAIYRQAFTAVDNDRWKEARRLADTAHNPLPAKIIQWLDLTRPGPGRDFREMTAFLSANPDWPLRETLFSQAERAMPEDLPPAQTIAWFGSRDPNTADGTIKLAGALHSVKQVDRATSLVRNGWIDLDFSKDDETVFLRRFGRLLSERDHEARLDRLIWDNSRDQISRMLSRVDAGHKALAQARLALLDQAANASSLLAQVPQSLRKDAGLIYAQARWLRLKGDVEKAAALLDPPPKHVLRPAKMWMEYKRAARTSLDKGDISVAYRLAASHGATSGEAFVEGEWLAGWISLRFLDDPATATKHFTGLYAGAKSAISQASAAYWAGRAAEQSGNKVKAQEWYRTAAKSTTTFYGLLAAYRLHDKQIMRLHNTQKPDAATKAAFDRRELTKAARLLNLLGEEDRTRPFILKLREMATKPSDYYLTAQLATEVNRDDLAVSVAKQARTAGVEMVQYLYPMPVVPKGGDPEPALVLAIIRQESAFLDSAVSPAGAMGLMQLMPATAKGMAKEIGVKKHADKMLTTDPQYNIKLGSAYLSKLINRFNGSYILAAAGYNAGPSRARDWTYTYGDPRETGTDVIDWIESIPFDETRNYVQRVMENLEIYRARLNKGVIKLTLEEDLRRHNPQ